MLLYKGQQEDIDFIIAFKDKKQITHIVLIEAKGVTSWSTKQLKSKAERLSEIFHGYKEKQMQPHFVLMSPKKSDKISGSIGEWPEWMKGYKHIPLKTNNSDDAELLKVIRCDKNAKAKSNGEYWAVVER